MPFSTAIDAWAASEPSNPASALPNDATALRRDWVTTSAPTSVRSVEVSGAAMAWPLVSSRSQPGDPSSIVTRQGSALGMSARRSLRCCEGDTSESSRPASPSRTLRAGSPSRVGRSSSTASSARSSLPRRGQHRRRDLGQLGRAHHRGHELVVRLEALVAVEQAPVGPVADDARQHDGGQHQQDVGVVPQRGGEADADGGVQQGGDGAVAHDHRGGVPVGDLAVHEPDADREGDGGEGERAEQRHQQGERALHADDVRVPDDDAEQQDGDDDLQAVHGQLVHHLLHLALAGHDHRGHQGDGDAAQPGDDQRARRDVGQPDRQRDEGEGEAVGLAVDAFDAQGDELAPEEGDRQQRRGDVGAGGVGGLVAEEERVEAGGHGGVEHTSQQDARLDTARTTLRHRPVTSLPVRRSPEHRAARAAGGQDDACAFSQVVPSVVPFRHAAR